jgi:hypothetical protein
MPQLPASVSNTQADRAGDMFRRFSAAADPEQRRSMVGDVILAIRVIRDYRSLHAYPLRKVTMGVRQMIETELGADPPRPGQRFKRMDRILPKLLRFPHMRLSQMEDIGGCRASSKRVRTFMQSRAASAIDGAQGSGSPTTSRSQRMTGIARYTSSRGATGG